MLAVGRALVLNPRLLLLDEPLEGLAPIIVEELLKAIARITREEGLSAIIVEQHPQAILAISHRAVVLDHGTVVHSRPGAGTERSARAAGPPAGRGALDLIASRRLSCGIEETCSPPAWAPLLTWPARSQAFPSRPLKIVVPNAAGGAADLTARTVGQKLAAAARPERGGREQAQRRRHRRRGSGGPGRARRPHHAAGVQRHGGERGAVQVAAVRHAEGLRAGVDAGHLRPGDRGEGGRSLPHPGRTAGRGPRPPRQAQSRHAADRHHAEPGGGAVQGHARASTCRWCRSTARRP